MKKTKEEIRKVLLTLDDGEIQRLGLYMYAVHDFTDDDTEQTDWLEDRLELILAQKEERQAEDKRYLMELRYRLAQLEQMHEYLDRRGSEGYIAECAFDFKRNEYGDYTAISSAGYINVDVPGNPHDGVEFNCEGKKWYTRSELESEVWSLESKYGIDDDYDNLNTAPVHEVTAE